MKLKNLHVKEIRAIQYTTVNNKSEGDPNTTLTKINTTANKEM